MGPGTSGNASARDLFSRVPGVGEPLDSVPGGRGQWETTPGQLWSCDQSLGGWKPPGTQEGTLATRRISGFAYAADSSIVKPTEADKVNGEGGLC